MLVEQLGDTSNSDVNPMRSNMQIALARVQTKLSDFDAAAKTLDDLTRESAAGNEFQVSTISTLQASNLFAEAVAEGSIETTTPIAIKLLEEAIDGRARAMKANGQNITGKENIAKHQSLIDFVNAADYLSVGSLQAIAGLDDAAMKTLERTRVAIDSKEKFYQESITNGMMDGDETSVELADQRAAIAEIQQMILVRNGKFEEALVIAEQSRGEVQSKLLERRMRISPSTDEAQPSDIKQIQSVADSQKTTLVYFSLVHALDPATRGFFKKHHTVNSAQQLYIWVVRPQQKIEFRSQVLPVHVDDLVASAREEIFAFMNESDNQQVVEDDKNSLATDVEVVRMLSRSVQPVAAPIVDASDGSALRKLHQLLIEPIEQWLPTSTDEIVTFVPQGKLFVVPFAALNDQDDVPLIVKHTISISPSARLLALADQEFQKVKQKDNQGVLIVGNPTMPSYQVRPDEPAVQLPPLPGTEAEADFIADLFDVQALKGGEADERSVVEAMKSARFIHLATHGILEADNSYAQSYLSSLALAPTDGEDGFLTVRETMRMNLNAEMAVLSGCDTGRGRITGDGVVGLARGYISSGVPTVVVSLWPVSDNSTAVLMAMYYKELLGGAGKAASLRTAMLKTRQQFAQPHAWSAFTLYGYSR